MAIRTVIIRAVLSTRAIRARVFENLKTYLKSMRISLSIYSRDFTPDANFACYKNLALIKISAAFMTLFLTHFKASLYYKYKLDWETRCLYVLDHPVFNNHYRYQTSTRVLDKKLDRVFDSSSICTALVIIRNHLRVCLFNRLLWIYFKTCVVKRCSVVN